MCIFCIGLILEAQKPSTARRFFYYLHENSTLAQRIAVTTPKLNMSVTGADSAKGNAALANHFRRHTTRFKSVVDLLGHQKSRVWQVSKRGVKTLLSQTLNRTMLR